MRRSVVIYFAAVVFALIFAADVQAIPTTYSGSLSASGGGLVGISAWDSSSTVLEWTVDDSTSPGYWHYWYKLTVPVGAVSHMIIEVSDDDPGPAFTLANVFNLSSDPCDWVGDKEVKLNKPAQGNPGMPGDMYGIKLNANAEDTIVEISFDSNRRPGFGVITTRKTETRAVAAPQRPCTMRGSVGPIRRWARPTARWTTTFWCRIR